VSVATERAGRLHPIAVMRGERRFNDALFSDVALGMSMLPEKFPRPHCVQGGGLSRARVLTEVAERLAYPSLARRSGGQPANQ
jgi:hypothetical protein